jgi:phage/plasmid-associated DNA primase
VRGKSSLTETPEFAGNITLPRLTDRSEGIYRRLFLVPMKKEILNPDKQDKRLLDPEFWNRSGELPGVFNWALDGLKRLRNRKYFVRSREMETALEDYKLECNPVRLFFADCCVTGPEEMVSVSELYDAYKVWSTNFGYLSMNEGNFGNEVKQSFPMVYKSNPLRIGVRRERYWRGVGILKESVLMYSKNVKDKGGFKRFEIS